MRFFGKLLPAGVILAAFAVCPAPEAAAEGAPASQPSASVGWRGDGNGRYVDATPPLTWGRVSNAVKDLSFQAKKPKADDKGKPMTDGVVREWLVVGPVAIPEGKAIKDEFGTDEAKLEPAEGDKLGDLAWKAVTTDTSWLNFWPMFGKDAKEPGKAVAYAAAWIHSAGGKPVLMNAQVSNMSKIWLNGKEAGAIQVSGGRIKLALQKGWNSLVIRVSPQTDTGWSRGQIQWHLNASFFGTETDEFESKNIAWSTPLPDNGPGIGSPTLVGDKLLVEAEGAVLVCVSAKDGKVLWARSSTYADAATPEERKANPDVFAEADKLTAKVAESLKDYCKDPAKYFADPKGIGERIGNERKINTLLTKMDPKKYPGQTTSEAGEAAPTPAGDGQCVYALYGSGVVACFDLDGNRKWTTALDVKHSEHGYCASPTLFDGKLVIKAAGYLGDVTLDPKTGAVLMPIPLWKTRGLSMYSTPLPLTVGGERMIVQSFGVITRSKDGKILAQTFTPPYYNCFDYVSPAAEGNTVCSLILPKTNGGTRWAFQTLPDKIAEPLAMKDTKEVEYDCKAFPCWFSYDHCASPLLYQGLAYIVSVDGVLTVIDAAKGEVLYQRLLDFAPVMTHVGLPIRCGCSSSPTLAGKYIYIWDDQNTCVIIEPGREFKQIARNRIEQPWIRYGPEFNECTISNPVFAGDKLYLRGEVNLYCIQEKAK